MRLVAAGIGSACAGPLGSVLGAWLGDIASDEKAHELLSKAGVHIGELASSVGSSFFYDQIKEFPPEPQLADVVRQSLQLALRDVRSDLPPDQKSSYGAQWFDHWDNRLNQPGPVVFESTSIARLHAIRQRFDPADAANQHPDTEQVANLDVLFQATMERLAGESRHQQSGSTSLNIEAHFLDLDAPLLAILTERLPGPLSTHFKFLLSQKENDAAWKQHWQDLWSQMTVSLETRLASIKEDTTLILENTGEIKDDVAAIRQMIEEQAAARNLGSEEIQELRSQVEHYRQLYEEAVRDAEQDARVDPTESAFAEFLKKRELDNAVKAKQEEMERDQRQIELAQDEASAKRAKDYFELARVHELRFAWDEAHKAYAKAWALEKNPGYGFGYALFCGQQNLHRDGISAYEALIPLLDDQPDDKSGALSNVGNLYQRFGDFEKAEIAYGEALEAFRDLAAEAPEANQRHVAMTLNNLAALYRDTQRLADAETAFTEALQIRRQLAQANPPAYLPDVATTLNNLAVLYRDTQRLADAETAFSEALQIRRQLAQANPPAYLPYVATTLNNLAIPLPRHPALGRRRDRLLRSPPNPPPAGPGQSPGLSALCGDDAQQPRPPLPRDPALGRRRDCLLRSPPNLPPAGPGQSPGLSALRRDDAQQPRHPLPRHPALGRRRDCLLRSPPDPPRAGPGQSPGLSARCRDDAQQPRQPLPRHPALGRRRGRLHRSPPIHRELAQANPSAYLPYVATTLNNLAVLYKRKQRFQYAEVLSQESLDILEPLWKAEPAVHGNQIAKDRWTMADILMAQDQGNQPKALELLRRALDATYEPHIKEAIQRRIVELS